MESVVTVLWKGVPNVVYKVIGVNSVLTKQPKLIKTENVFVKMASMMMEHARKDKLKAAWKMRFK